MTTDDDDQIIMRMACKAEISYSFSCRTGFSLSNESQMSRFGQ